MSTAAKPRRENRTITVDFRDEATYFRLIADGKAFVECVLAFLLALGFQLKHQATCDGGGCLTRHSHDVRIRLGGIAIWRLQCTRCRAVFTVLPHFVLRYRQLHPEVARDALLAIHGSLSLEWCAAICHVSPMALYRLICAFGQQSLVAVLTRCGLPLPAYFLADEKHSHCLTEKVYLPTIVNGRLIWHLGYTENASAVALTQSYGEFQRAASQQEPAYRVRGILTDGFDSTTKSLQTLFPVSATACATRSSSFRRNWQRSRRRSVGPCARSSTPCGTGRGSAKACACLRWASGCGALRTTSRTQPGQPTAHVCGSGSTTRVRHEAH
jgi:hypothetical protein